MFLPIIMSSSFNKRYTHFALFILILLSFIFSGCTPRQFKTPMFQPNDNNGRGPNALAWNGRDIVIADNSLIMAVNSIETGIFFSRSSDFNSDGFFSFAKSPEQIIGNGNKNIKICGTAWEGECCGKGFLWIADSENKEILKLNSNNKVIKRIASPAASPHGLAFDGKDLWVADSKAARIYRVATEDGTILSEYISPVNEPAGLAWDHSNLWVIGMNACSGEPKACYKTRLVKLDVSLGKVIEEIDLPAQIRKPSALVFIDGDLWISDYELNRIFQVSAEGLEVTAPTVYLSQITRRSGRSAVKDMPGDEKGMVEKEQVAAANTPILTDKVGEAVETAKKAAEEAKAAATAAEDSARKAEKAFELQQRK